MCITGKTHAVKFFGESGLSPFCNDVWPSIIYWCMWLTTLGSSTNYNRSRELETKSVLSLMISGTIRNFWSLKSSQIQEWLFHHLVWYSWAVYRDEHHKLVRIKMLGIYSLLFKSLQRLASIMGVKWCFRLRLNYLMSGSQVWEGWGGSVLLLSSCIA